jgi:hypothetical protein
MSKGAMKINTVQRVASYHEAGHAVVARLLGQACPSVSIEIDNAVAMAASAAHAACEAEPAARIAAYETDAKISLAGPLAQAMSRPSSNDRAVQVLETHEEDFSNAQNAAACCIVLGSGQPLPEPGEGMEIKIDAHTLDVRLKRLQQETRTLLKQNWPWLKRVAQALRERGRLDQAEVDRLRGE